MPVSSNKGKSIITDWFAKQKDIKTIVDLGPGSATYPKLLGDKYTWKCVEIWKPYVKRFDYPKYYDEIVIGDISDVKLPRGDCAILGDVLEHLPKERAVETFHKVDKQFDHVVISIPLDSASQHVEQGNEYERHISIWSLEELEAMIPDNYKTRGVVYPLSIYIK